MMKCDTRLKKMECRYHRIGWIEYKNPHNANVYFIDGPRYETIGGNQYKYAKIHYGFAFDKDEV